MSIKNYVYFFLGILFPSFVLVNANIEVISTNDFKNILFLAFFLLAISISINVVFYKIFKLNFLKLVVFLINSNFLTSLLIFSGQVITIKKFIILNVFFTLIFIIIFYVLKNRDINFKKFSNFFFFTLAVYASFTCANLIFNTEQAFQATENKANIFYQSPYSELSLKKKPDIIHIIPDSLMNLDGLQNAGYNVNQMKNEYKKMGIQIYKDSLSNYTKTHFSLSSYFNGSIIKEDLLWKEKNMYKYINNSMLHNQLIKNGYQVEWYETRWLGSRCKKRENIICANKAFLNNELFNTLFRSLNFNPAWVEKLYFVFFKKEKIRFIDVITDNVDKFETEKPRYIYGYLELPHPPFKVRSNCGSAYLYFSEGKIQQDQFNKNQYLQQVDCFTLQMKKLIKKLNKRNKDYVIIIQSDTGHYVHGYERYPNPKNNNDYPKEVYQAFFGISSNLTNCFDRRDNKGEVFFNVEAFSILFKCLGNKKYNQKLTNKTKLYSIYHHDHQKYGKIYTNKDLN